MNVIHGSWCAQCYGNVRKSLNDLKKVAKSRGGKCLSTKYISGHRQIDWECRQGHYFSLNWNKVQQGGWCPTCNKGIGERITRAYFEQIFRERFDPAWPEWLRNEEGNALELDGYSEKLKLAFEHQGIQHYKNDAYYSKNFKKRQRDDKQKLTLCRRHGIKIIRVPELNTFLKVDELLVFLINEFDKKKIVYPRNISEIDFDLSDAYSYSVLNEMERFATNNGGRLISRRYLGREKLYNWECGNGHRFKVQYASLLYNKRKGSWCPECRRSNSPRRLSLEDIKKRVEELGGKLLSKRYINSNHKLEFMCEKGHTWKALPLGVLKGRTWCSTCAGNKKLDINVMHEMAKERDGEFLSTEYRNARTRYWWKCKYGHKWQATAGSIRNQGTWCYWCGRETTARKLRRNT